MKAIIRIANLERVRARLAAIQADLAPALDGATEAIAQAMEPVIDQNYAKVAKYFQFDATGTAVSITSTDIKVWWYEHGTKPHGIWPVNKKALKFTPRGQETAVVVAHVNHPGTEAHDMSEPTMTALRQIAREEWTQAIAAILRA